MTLGKRIQDLRKQRGMSQESLGEALGVSRQAVSKWECDNGIPELDALISMSRLFGVTVGQLLGVEETAEQEGEPEQEVDEDKIESILRRYTEQTKQKDERSWLARWGWIGSAAIILITVFLVMFAQLNSLRTTVKLLRGELSSLQVTVSNNQNNLSGQIRNTIYDVLAEEDKLLSTFRWEVVGYDPDNQTATLRLDATMKEYTAGSRLQFCAAWHKTDDTKGRTDGEWVDGPDFSSELTIPLNHSTEISIRVEDEQGNIKEQALQNNIYHLHPDNFHLSAYNLTTPFAVTVKGFGVSMSTAKAERAYIDIMSAIPELVWPEKAVVTAYVNDEEIMSETMSITESKREEQVFWAAIEDVYCDLTMKNGDVLKVVLDVTDNLGRTEQFVDSREVKDGELERVPQAAPVISVNG